MFVLYQPQQIQQLIQSGMGQLRVETPFFNTDYLESYRTQVVGLTTSLGNELLTNRYDYKEAEQDDSKIWRDVLVQLRVQFLQQQSRIKEYENCDQYRMETDRAVRARIDLRGVEEQVSRELEMLRGLRYLRLL